MKKDYVLEVLNHISNSMDVGSDSAEALQIAIQSVSKHYVEEIVQEEKEEDSTVKKDCCSNCSSYNEAGSEIGIYMECEIIGYIEFKQDMNEDKFKCDFYLNEVKKNGN